MTQRKSNGSFVFAGLFENELLAGCKQPVQEVNNIFDAIGELATSNSLNLVDAIIVDELIVGQNPSSAIDALRRVDPTAVIVWAGDKPNKNADISIKKETTAQQLQSAIVNAKSLPFDIDSTHEVDLDVILGIAEMPEILEGSATSPLGDTDLVRALLHQPTHFRTIVLKLLKEQTGWTYCDILDDCGNAPNAASTVPLRYGHEEHGSLAAIGATEKDLRRWGRWVACWLELHRKQRNLKLLAYQDELSGAWNRRFLKTCFARELQLAKETRRPLTVMIFDIDNFKHYNDQWGHDAGDEIIREVVRLLRTIIRKGDHVCRIGGDEFAVLFCDPEPPREPGSNHPTTVEILAKRFREQVAKAKFAKLGDQATGVLSISGGLATFPWDGIDVDSILQKADERLFQSKRQGKNSITIGLPE